MPHVLLSFILAATAALLTPTPAFAAQHDKSAISGDSAASGDVGDCESKAELAVREACYAALPDVAIDECESRQPFRCAPYRDMHLAEAALATALVELAAVSRKTYADYTTADPSYVDDIDTGLREADRSWRAWRDAECALEPYLEGMSRREADGLTEACRADQTRLREEQLRSRIQQLEAGQR